MTIRENRSIYVASSWRNKYQPAVVDQLRRSGFDQVYDFREPEPGVRGFSWAEIDPEWEKWTAAQWFAALKHPLAVEGYRRDFEAMKRSDLCVLVLPSGRSSHLEAGWFAGEGRPVCVFAPEPVEPDLMVGMADRLTDSLLDVVSWAEEWAGRKTHRDWMMRMRDHADRRDQVLCQTIAAIAQGDKAELIRQVVEEVTEAMENVICNFAPDCEDTRGMIDALIEEKWSTYRRVTGREYDTTSLRAAEIRRMREKVSKRG